MLNKTKINKKTTTTEAKKTSKSVASKEKSTKTTASKEKMTKATALKKKAEAKVEKEVKATALKKKAEAKAEKEVKATALKKKAEAKTEKKVKATTLKKKAEAKAEKEVKATTLKKKAEAKTEKEVKATTLKKKAEVKAEKEVKATTLKKKAEVKAEKETEATTLKKKEEVKTEKEVKITALKKKAEVKTEKETEAKSIKAKNTEDLGLLENIVFEEKSDSFTLENVLHEDKQFKNNTVVDGQVVDIQDDFVSVDIQHKSIGLIPKEQFMNLSGEFKTSVGQHEKVYIERMEGMDGQIRLSKKKYNILEIWRKAEEYYSQGKSIQGTIIEKTKGGMKVDIGIIAFLPNSQIDFYPISNPASLIGKIYDFKILKCNRERVNIVLSRRALLETDRIEKRNKTLEKIKKGMIVKGVIKNIAKYGVFVDIGGIDGLLHITDITWGRVTHIEDIFKIGDNIDVMVLEMDLENNKVALGLKQKTEDPWNSISIQKGDIMEGKVVGVISYGVFVEIKPEVEGFVSNNEIIWSKTNVDKMSYVKTIGNKVKVLIKEIDKEEKKIALSIKALEPNIWKEAEKKLKKGDIIDGVISSITNYGIFVTTEFGINGLIYQSDIHWCVRWQSNLSGYKVGDKIQAKVISLKADLEKLSLSIKHLTSNPWRKLENKVDVGDIVNGEIVYIENYGIFLATHGVEGLLHQNKLSHDISTKQQIEEKYKIGDILQVKVLKLDIKNQKLAFSLPKSSKAAETAAKESSDLNSSKQSTEANNSGQETETSSSGQETEASNSGQKTEASNSGQETEVSNSGQEAEASNSGQETEASNPE